MTTDFFSVSIDFLFIFYHLFRFLNQKPSKQIKTADKFHRKKKNQVSYIQELSKHVMNSLQVEEKEVELNDVKSQLLNTQSVLSTAQIELDSLRNKGQQEELQIAEIKMMMHQVIYL